MFFFFFLFFFFHFILLFIYLFFFYFILSQFQISPRKAYVVGTYRTRIKCYMTRLRWRKIDHAWLQLSIRHPKEIYQTNLCFPHTLIRYFSSSVYSIIPNGKASEHRSRWPERANEQADLYKLCPVYVCSAQVRNRDNSRIVPMRFSNSYTFARSWNERLQNR